MTDISKLIKKLAIEENKVDDDYLNRKVLVASLS